MSWFFIYASLEILYDLFDKAELRAIRTPCDSTFPILSQNLSASCFFVVLSLLTGI